MSGVGNGVPDEENALVVGQTDPGCLNLRAYPANGKQEEEGKWFHLSEQVRLFGFTDLDLMLSGNHGNGQVSLIARS